MRGTAWVLLALVACGDDDGEPPTTDASVRLDGSATLDATLINKCGPVIACQSGMITELPQLCIGSVNAQPSGDLWKVCVIDPQGRTAYIQIRADERITSAGWTFSNYAFVDSTLAGDGFDKCLTERSRLIVATEENLPDAGNALCYRPSSGNEDD
jgi:hypothetical protein